jgi:transcriptional regulator with XRE-family HTH domain
MTDWTELRGRRLTEPGAAQAHEAARLAYDFGRAVRGLREHHGCRQIRLAQAAGMARSALARFEAGGTVPAAPFLAQLVRALSEVTDIEFVELLDELRRRHTDPT